MFGKQGTNRMTEKPFKDILEPYKGRGREALLPVLWDIQTIFGYISAEAVQQISYVLRVPEADIYGVVEFYTLFYLHSTGNRIIRVCTDPSCSLAGADQLADDVCVGLTEIRPDEECTVERSTCLGLCEHAPAALITEANGGEKAIAPATANHLIHGEGGNDYPIIAEGKPAILLKNTGDDAEFLEQYGDYQGLRRAIFTLSPDKVIEMVQESGLLGRGGAEFPTNLKWRFTQQAEQSPKYVVCNADESEPGTFKDRVLMECRPHQLIEGMAIAAYAIGAETAYLFIRGEYPRAQEGMKQAIQEARDAGMIGENIMGSDVTVNFEIRRGAGAYVCGEETALFEAIEGKRAFPRIKPPYPATHGLFNHPTVVNNVETLSAVADLILNGAEWFKQYGTEHSTGTKLVSVSGHVNHPGVYEIVPGITMRHLLDDLCGGVQGQLQAILMGGASGTFLSPDELDVPVSFEGLRTIGSSLGSGAVMVFNDTANLKDILQRLTRFFRHESCGKCYPCQLGTQRQHEILERIDTPMNGDRQRLFDVGLTMQESSICGLGQTAASAVMSAITKFPHLLPDA
jgi:NADH-quinone oxidoreductase subunit F